jgi:hypothetical protein
MVSHLGVVHVVHDSVVKLWAISFEESIELTMRESWWLSSTGSDVSWHILAVISNWVLEVEA